MWNSSIVRISSGTINKVNDTIIGGVAAPSGVSRFAGQLGQPVWLDDGETIRVVPVPNDPLRALRGRGRGKGLTERLLAERQADRDLQHERELHVDSLRRLLRAHAR